MPNVFRQFDWKIVVFALLGCYLVPALVFGSIAASASSESVQGDWATELNVFYGLAIYIGSPIAGGYFTARFASNRPKLHVLAVAIAGISLACLSYRGSWLTVAAYVTASLLLAALGAFVYLRRQPSEEA